MDRKRLLVASLALNFALTVAALGWLTWIVTQPRHWFPAAYSQQGPPGIRGPRGPVGATGAPGPVGPDASSAIDDLSSRLDDLESGSGDQSDMSVDDLSSTVDDLSSRVDDLETGSGDDVGTSVSDLIDTLQGMCDSMSTSDGQLYDAYLAAC